MKNVLIINGHHPYPFSEGKLSAEVVRRIENNLIDRGFDVDHTATASEYDVEREVEKHRWADLIIIQAPLNWFSVPWTMKKYMDDVYTAGLDGRICRSDGRVSAKPKENYGTGGQLNGRKYMLSMTFNAPEEAFNDPSEFLMQGKSVEDLMLHMHVNYRFLGMESLPTFVCYDVMKNPTIEDDFVRLEAHLDHYIHSAR